MFEGALLAGRFRLISQIGDGGMGRVWLARHVKLGRLVALKVLHHERHADALTRERFRREALAAGALCHEGIVQPLDFGSLDDGRDFLALEHVEGTTLSQIVAQRGSLPWRAVLRVAWQVTEALAYAHARGVVHRDLTPANIIVEGDPATDGKARILDFGIARIDGGPSRTTLTQRGMVLGTPSFAAPEQLRGDPVDGRADLWSLGATLYYLLSGRRPFEGTSFGAVVEAQAAGPPPPLSEVAPDPTRPPSVDQLIAELMSFRPEWRPATAEDTKSRLLTAAGQIIHEDQAGGGTTHPARPGATWTVVAIGIGLGMLVLGTAVGAAIALLASG